MDELDRLHLLTQLAEEFCDLNHGPNSRREDFPAVNYLVLPVGYKENVIQEVTARELVVPVCHCCATALQGNEWTLLFCSECSASRWVCRQLAKNAYRHHILWLGGCPDCTYEFGGLYFNDFDSMAEDAPDCLAYPLNLCAS